MLEKISIKNLALIDYTEIEFDKGLNVLSGETGSGKSIIIDSLNFVLGARADKSLIKTGSEECIVTAIFDVQKNLVVKDILTEFDFDADDTLIISRKLNTEGKSTIKINGNSVSLSMLKKITSELVDIHGQSEHFQLISTANQLKLIDDFGGELNITLKKSIKVIFNEYKSIISQLNEVGGNDENRAIKTDILKYQIKQIQTSDIKNGELEELLVLKNKLQNQEKILNCLSGIRASVSEEGGILDNLSSSNRMISQISDISEKFSEMSSRIESVYMEMNDISNEISNYISEFDFSDYSLDDVEQRVDEIKTIFKLYGGDFESVQNFLNNVCSDLYKLENFDKYYENLLKKKKEIEITLFDKYTELSVLRKNTCDIFCKEVLNELFELGMEKSQFQIEISSPKNIEECTFSSENGFDSIKFMFSANIGEPVKPLANVISGGEMSRLMLSIKAISSLHNNINSYIFDEIDVGISGKTAKVVAEKFAKISKHNQLIAITHLPQISAMADNNVLIEKVEKNNKTITTTKKLSKEDKIIEIVRLSGGEADNQHSLEHAKDMINSADKFKSLL